MIETKKPVEKKDKILKKQKTVQEIDREKLEKNFLKKRRN